MNQATDFTAATKARKYGASPIQFRPSSTLKGGNGMNKIIFSAVVVASGLWWVSLTDSRAQSPAHSEGRPPETTASHSFWGVGTEESFGTIARIQQFQKLVDDKNYEKNTIVQLPSVNGGDRIERSIQEKARKLDENHFTVERLVQNPDGDGRLQTVEVMNEDHLKQGKVEEIKRSTFRPDLNGKLQARVVEQETLTKVSKGENQIEKAVYRLDLEGKLSLSEMEEGQEKRVGDNVMVKEMARQTKDVGGRMAKVESIRETTVKTAESSFHKETVIQRTDDNGRLGVAEKMTEVQTEKPDGTRQYTRVLESRNIPLYPRSTDSRALILYKRVSGEERKLPDGSIENTSKVETLDPTNFSDGLKVSEMITEIARPLANGRISVERVVKVRDLNGNYVVSLRSVQTVEPAK